MDFDQLMEFVGADEEMGRMYHYGCNCLIDIRTNEGKNVLNIYCYSTSQDEYEMVLEFLNLNCVKYHHSDTLELRSGKIIVDVDTACVFCVNDYCGGEPDSVVNMEGKYIEQADACAHLQIRRKNGKKKLEVTFFISSLGFSIVESFLNCYSVTLSKSYEECIGELLTVQLEVKCHFLPIKDRGD